MKIGLPEVNMWWNAFLRFNSQSGTHLSGLVLTIKALSLPSWGLVLSVTIRVELLCTWNDEIWSAQRWCTPKTEEMGYSCDNGEYQCDVTMPYNMRNMTKYYVLQITEPISNYYVLWIGRIGPPEAEIWINNILNLTLTKPQKKAVLRPYGSFNQAQL